MAKLIDIVYLHDNCGNTIGQRYRYTCDGNCGRYVLRAIRMGKRRTFCYECRRINNQIKRIENEANKKREEYIRERINKN